ncbi:aminotransferase class IV [Brevundimonas diminuta]|uniref:aminotransferase class IV n=1 Tax=Brevundimonas diminuta TaxID=293 RepID=UPI003CFEF778
MAVELWIDGRPAGIEDLGHQALINYGALTSFAVEEGGVRGLDRHLDRLNRSAVELFGEAVAEDRLRDQIRTALAGRDDAWLRVSLFFRELSLRQPDWIGAPQVMISVAPPPSPLPDGVRLQSQVYGREAPHLKHVATMGLLRARRVARLAGYDDALFVDAEGLISEGSLWNVGFIQGDAVVWPDAPMLDGVAQTLIREALDRAGSPQREAVVRLTDLTRFDGAFLCNSATPAAGIAAIDDHVFSGAADAVQHLNALWRSQPRQKI